MEALLATGKTRAIGVCNFNQAKLADLLTKTSVVPAVNQIEAHPYLQQPELLKYCREHGILVQAYSPLGNNQLGVPKTVDDPKVQALAAELDMDPGQLLYSWGLQRGTVVLPKSVTPVRIESNLRVREIPADAFERLNALECHRRFNIMSHWGVDIFDELGKDKAVQMGREAGPENLKKFNA
jgi:diketogulonate reductase-like aldo/keto reductase